MDIHNCTRHAIRLITAVTVTILHVVLVISLLYATLCGSKEDAFMLFFIISVILISFCYFQRCVLHAMETLYNPAGCNYIGLYHRMITFFKAHIVIGKCTVDQSITLQVILLGMTLIIIKICLFIVRDFCMGKQCSPFSHTPCL